MSKKQTAQQVAWEIDDKLESANYHGLTGIGNYIYRILMPYLSDRLIASILRKLEPRLLQW